MPDRTCTIEGCEKPAFGRGWCQSHYVRWLKAGGVPRRQMPHGAGMRILEDLIAIETDDCVLWPWGKNPAGYGRFVADGKETYAHVESCRRAHGPKPPSKYGVAHSCGVPACVNPRHLRWATTAENNADKKIHGSIRGERNPRAILTEADVAEIRRGYVPGWGAVPKLARRYGVTPETIQAVIRRLSWKHVA